MEDCFWISAKSLIYGFLVILKYAAASITTAIHFEELSKIHSLNTNIIYKLALVKWLESEDTKESCQCCQDLVFVFWTGLMVWWLLCGNLWFLRTASYTGSLCGLFLRVKAKQERQLLLGCCWRETGSSWFNGWNSKRNMHVVTSRRYIYFKGSIIKKNLTKKQ